jgi:hypothetical protein
MTQPMNLSNSGQHFYLPELEQQQLTQLVQFHMHEGVLRTTTAAN